MSEYEVDERNSSASPNTFPRTIDGSRAKTLWCTVVALAMAWSSKECSSWAMIDELVVKYVMEVMSSESTNAPRANPAVMRARSPRCTSRRRLGCAPRWGRSRRSRSPVGI